MTTALILAGHGSHISAQTAALIWSLVDALRALGVADEIAAAFWKEFPSFHRVLHTITADDITVVPLFTARGYFTQTVIPAEFGLSGALTRRGERLIRYARTLNEHPFLSQVVRQRVEEGIAALGSSPHETAVAILGHSTRRNPESRLATEAQAAAIRAANLAAEVVAAYLDDTPTIADVYTMTAAPTLIAVPYFLAPGSHTTIDVPRELCLEPGQREAQINGRRVYYTDPVGTDAALREVILELAREAGAPLAPPRSGASWDCFPAAGRAELAAAVSEADILQFGELSLSLSAVHVMGDHPTATLDSTAALRHYVRENPFRPLPTARGLPRGWRVNIGGDAARLHAVVETVYPGAVADWASARRGHFEAVPFSATIARQTGMFRKLHSLAPDERAELVASICKNCVLHPAWHDAAQSVLPCPEACNIWLSGALERKV